MVFSLWLFDAEFSIARSTARRVVWAGEQGGHAVAIQILSLLHRGRRTVIPKRTSSPVSLRDFGSVHVLLQSASSVLSCQFSLSSPCGGNCRLHDLENGCNPKRRKKGKLLCLTSLFFI